MAETPNKKSSNMSKNNLPTFSEYYNSVVENRVDPQLGILWLDGTIGEDINFIDVDAALHLLEIEHKTILIKLNSGGGAVYDAFAIASRIANSPSKIIVEAQGLVASAALLLLAVGDVRISSAFTTFMHHDSHTYIQGRFHNLTNTINAIKLEEKRFADMLSQFTKRDSAWWESKAVPEFWFGANEALEFGLIDNIIQGKKNEGTRQSEDAPKSDAGTNKSRRSPNKKRNKKSKESAKKES